MATLIVEQPGHRIGGRVPWRVLIGRLPTNGIALTDSSVSRLHAWVATAPQDDRKHYVADTGSLTGTYVNGKPINKRQDLVDGDVIRIGKTEITYSAADALPPDVLPIGLAGSPPIANVNEAGVLFDCVCGAPVWFKATAIGHTHHCRHCGSAVRIPEVSGVVAQQVDAPTIIEPGVPPAPVVGAAPVAAPPPPPSDDPMLLHAPLAGAAELAEHPHVDEHGLGEMHDLATEHHLDEHGLGELTLSEAHAASTGGTPTVDAHDDHLEPLHLELAPTPDHSASESELDLMLAEAETEPAQGGHAPATAAPDDAFNSPVAIESLEQPLEGELSEPTPATPAAAEPTICSVCHTPIVDGEEMTTCPSCGLTFHTGCWQENLGCSAYGCPQVGALKPPEPEPEPAPRAPAVDTSRPPRAPSSTVAAAGRAMANRAAAATLDAEPAGFPWEFVFLFGSVVGIALGLWSYGVPSLIATLGTAIYLVTMQDSRKRRPVAVVALLLCFVGIFAGMYFSKLYFNNWPPMPWETPHAGGRP